MISAKYTFNNSTNQQFTIIRITRKPNTKPPTKKVTVVYEYASIDSSDTGTLVTANSYENFDYADIPTVDGLRQSDIIDIRPKVKSYTVSEGVRSPFEFLGRSFNSTQNNNLNVLASDETIELDCNLLRKN